MHCQHLSRFGWYNVWTTKIILFDLTEDKKKDFDLSEYDKKDDSEQEDCENELQTGFDLSGYPGQQGLSFLFNQ